MEGPAEECSPLWALYQQIVADMKNSTPMWEEFISKATKLHSALKSALSAIAAFLDAFQKIADAATNARGASKEIGTALTRVCLRHRAIETRMKTFVGVLMDTLITPLSERSEEWRRGGGSGGGALSREHARECKRARAELRRRVHDAQRSARKARRAPDAKRRADVSMQDVQERRVQLEEMEERALRAALVEERTRFCHFVAMLGPVVESEVSMLSELGHLAEGSDQLRRHSAEPAALPPATLQVISDLKASSGAWEGGAAGSPPASRLGSRKSSLTSLCSVNTNAGGGSPACSTPLSGASSAATLPGLELQHLSLSQSSASASADSGFRSQELRLRLTEHGSDSQSVCSEGGANDSGSAWPLGREAAQFARAAAALLSARPHTISAASSRAPGRAPLSVHQFSPANETSSLSKDTQIYARPPLPTRCSSLERPALPVRAHSASKDPNAQSVEHRPKPSPLPPHLAKDLPAAVYVNMSELASLAAARAQHHAHNAQDNATGNIPPHGEKVCSESSASESSLESSSGYGSQGAFANEDHAPPQDPPLEAFCYSETVECDIVTLRRPPISPPPARRSLQCLPPPGEEETEEKEEIVPFATVTKPATRPRPLSLTAMAWSRRGSGGGAGGPFVGAPGSRPPPPVRRSSSISRPQGPHKLGSGPPESPPSEEHLPPPPAFLLQPDADAIAVHQNSVAETIKALTELKHTPASPSAQRRAAQLQAKGARAVLAGTETIYGHAGHRLLEQSSIYARKSSLNASLSELRGLGGGGGGAGGGGGGGGGVGLSSFGPREPERAHYGHTGFKLQQEKQYGAVYAAPAETRRAASAERRPSGLIASLSAKLAPQLSPRAPRRSPAQSALAPSFPAPSPHAPSASAPSTAPPGFLDKLSATISLQRRALDPARAATVRDIINAHAQPDPRACHNSLMEQIRRGATLKRNQRCDDRSAPMIR